ncbi:MAG: ATP-dependent helicase [Thermodesulfobacteriota bacterium]|nr:ATP-dependent helicase [Thermodesulfobacteriota bacterium]
MPLIDYEEIVTHFEAPTLVLAGPGAGKTYLLADRITRLLDSGVDKDKITVLTFGRDASRHMEEELFKPDGDFKIPWDNLPLVSTMHSLGLSIVKEKPLSVKLKKKGLEVQNLEEVKRLLFRDAALIFGQTENDSLDASKCKACGDCSESPGEEYCQICYKYREIMSKCNCIDFDDQIHFSCQILEKYPDILEKYQAQAEHLLVDEYQDINAAQFKMIELLSRENRKGLFAVGDDAQSIYAFRGGDPKFILRFKDDFLDAKVTTLAHSRRCHENIMEDSFKVLENHYPDWTGKPDLTYHKETGDKPYIWHVPSEMTEAKFVAGIAKDAVQQKKTVLILVPKKEFFPFLMNALTKRQVPHSCSIDLLPDRVGIAKRFIDWVQDPNDNFQTRLVIEDLINKGVAHVAGADKDGRSSEETIEKRIEAETAIAELWDSVDKDNDLYLVIQNLETPNNNLEKVREALLNLEESYKSFKRDNRGEFAKRLAFLSGIWVDPSDMAADITDVVRLIQTEQPFGSTSAQLLTMRKAKGLEAQVVIIVGLEDDVMPNPRSENTEEEARLLYVSMTRAKERIYLFHSYKRPRNISYGQALTEKPRSKFLDALGRKSEWKRLKKKK